MGRQNTLEAPFQTLRQGPPFLIPNPWDAGSARLLESLGLSALEHDRRWLCLFARRSVICGRPLEEDEIHPRNRICDQPYRQC